MKKTIFLTSLFASFFLNAASSEDLVKTNPSWDGTVIPPQQISRPQVMIKKIIIEPGEKLSVHYHTVVNAGILLEGRLKVVKESTGETLQLEEGDTIVELINQDHYGVNNGDKPAKIVVVYFGEVDQDVTVVKAKS
jgi:quercetin dioxygenase-like cupin family protein